MSKRTDTEILKDLVEAVMEYNSLSDYETHEELLKTIWEIWESRKKVRNLLIEATGDKTISF